MYTLNQTETAMSALELISDLNLIVTSEVDLSICVMVTRICNSEFSCLALERSEFFMQ